MEEQYVYFCVYMWIAKLVLKIYGRFCRTRVKIILRYAMMLELMML